MIYIHRSAERTKRQLLTISKWLTYKIITNFSKKKSLKNLRKGRDIATFVRYVKKRKHNEIFRD